MWKLPFLQIIPVIQHIYYAKDLTTFNKFRIITILIRISDKFFLITIIQTKLVQLRLTNIQPRTGKTKKFL